MSKPKDPEAPGHGNNDPPPAIMTDKPKATSWKQTCCVVMAILLFMSTAVFTALFVVYYIMPGQEVASSKEEACNTPGCIMTASNMIKLMNATADPCDDFSQFACGRFYKEAKILDGYSIDLFSSLDDLNKDVLKEIVTGDVSPGDPRYLMNIKKFYKSCLDEDKIEKIGVAPFLNDTDFVNDWPTLNPAWNGNSFNLSDVIIRYSALTVLPFFNFDTYATYGDHSKFGLMVVLPTTLLDSFYFAIKGAKLTAYQAYLTELAISLGADAEVAARDVKALVDFQAKLYTMVLYSELFPSKGMARIKMSALRFTYPQIDIAGAIRSAFGIADFTMAEDLNVYIKYPGYMDYLNTSVTGVSNRTLQNLFSFERALKHLDDASRHLRELRFNFNKVVDPDLVSVPRWQTCLKKTTSIFQIGMNKQFLLKTFTEETQHYGEEIVANLQNSLRQLLNESTWLANATKEEAFRKLDLMESYVGYPDEYADDNYVVEFYENYTMTGGNYYANSILLLKLVFIEQLRIMLIKDYDPPTNLAHANGYYLPFYNRIEIPAALFLPPMFSLSQPHFVNYAAFGIFIGHEIMHGFDIHGSELDGEGYLNNWWQDGDREEYQNRTQCFVDQYSNFYIPEINMTVDGESTVGENMPDNVGLKLAHMAYKNLVKRIGEEDKLPGLSLTQDQLFFLSVAQTWCEKLTLEYLRSVVKYDEHSPSKYRILGMLQNSEDFAKAYNCPPGSYMNPEKKCTLF